MFFRQRIEAIEFPPKNVFFVKMKIEIINQVLVHKAVSKIRHIFQGMDRGKI